MVHRFNELDNISLAEALRQVKALYDGLDAEIDFQKPRCVASGRCCHFEAYGHRLYATRLELEYFRVVEMMPRLPTAGAESPTESQKQVPERKFSFPLPLFADTGEIAPGCPWQVNELCTARTGRPLGCRIYFCDPGSTAWQNNAYERYHRLLKILHDKAKLPYAYMEWRAGLGTLLSTPPPKENG